MMEQIANYIDGKLIPPVSGSYLDVVEPATGAVYAQAPDSDEADVARAVDAAAAAFAAWSTTPALERARLMNRLADLIDAHRDELARAESIDNGKPLAAARTLDIPRAALNFRFFAAAAMHLKSESHAMDGVAINYTLRQPRGVAGIISPWNLPLYLFSWKVAPALCVGCTVVAKPSEVTPMTAYMLTKLCAEAGLPDGVLNVVHGLGAKAGSAIVTHPRVPVVSFTGGTVTGREIAKQAAPMFKKVALEMGGKNPVLVFADADPEQVIRESLRSAFANQGQVCLCGSRMYVERSAFDAFVPRFVEAAKKLKVGDPLEEGTDQGALASKQQFDKVMSYLELAKRDGGTIHCGGKRPENLPKRCENGYFIEPTIITGLPLECRVNQEEVFGPVVTIAPFDGEDQAVEFANATDYGLCATVWTSDISRAHRLAEKLHAGTVWVNSWMLRDLRVPFGGTKQSGVGREGGEEALRIYTEPKNVCVRM